MKGLSYGLIMVCSLYADFEASRAEISAYILQHPELSIQIIIETIICIRI